MRSTSFHDQDHQHMLQSDLVVDSNLSFFLLVLATLFLAGILSCILQVDLIDIDKCIAERSFS